MCVKLLSVAVFKTVFYQIEYVRQMWILQANLIVFSKKVASILLLMLMSTPDIAVVVSNECG